MRYKVAMEKEKAFFSILIPSWNNLPYLKTCITALQKNSEVSHQIVVHVNEGVDGTTQWLQENNIEYSYSEQNIGICDALNKAFNLSIAPNIIYLNDDMYVLPGWDLVLKNEIEKTGHSRFYFSATMMERVEGNSCTIAPVDFGDLETGFKEEELLKQYNKFQKNDWNGATWPPSVVHRDMWQAVGGYSTEFSPGFYSDPDFSMKLWNNGVRLFKGLGNSRVYHFRSKSLKRVKLNNGRLTFMKKWGISASFLYKNILKMGSNFSGPLNDQSYRLSMLVNKITTRVKCMFK